MIAVYLFPETKNSYNPAAINCLKYPQEWLPLFTVFHIPVTRPRSSSPEGHRGERHGSSLYSRAFELSLWNDLWNTSQMNYCCGYLKKNICSILSATCEAGITLIFAVVWNSLNNYPISCFCQCLPKIIKLSISLCCQARPQCMQMFLINAIVSSHFFFKFLFMASSSSCVSSAGQV